MVRPLLLLLSIINSSALHPAEATSPQQALTRAVDNLWSQQHDDGSWSSEQYAVLRSGQALTPFVLHALLGSTDSLSTENAEKAQLAMRFIIEHLDADGALGRSDPDILEYPVYSTAYAILAIERLRALDPSLVGIESEHVLSMRTFLLNAQFDGDDGFTTAMAAFGGWGFNIAQQPGESGHMDLAHTRRALQALRTMQSGIYALADYDLIHSYHAQQFLRVLQKQSTALAVQPLSESAETIMSSPFDGGFYFSPVVLAANKGRFDEEENYWRSYATATCDGILALLAGGVPKDDERVTAAVGWLKKYTNLDYPQGVPTDHPEPWGEAIRFYHYAARAEVYRALDFPLAERAALAAAVIKHQRTDGSFVNVVSPLMKEDEPLLATALAVVALTHCLP